MSQESPNHRTPLFLIGPPRSGTTILTQVLNTSKYILITDELRASAWLVKEMMKINGGHEIHGAPYPFNRGNRFASYLQAQGSFFLLKFYEKIAQEDGKEEFIYWGDKYPHYDRYLKTFPRIFPRALYIAIFRDISEVINSVMVGHNWDFEKSLNYCKKIYQSYIDQMKAIDQENIFVFDYAQFKGEDPLIEIKKMFNFLNIEIDKNHENIIKSTLSYQSHSVRKVNNIGKKFSNNKTKNTLSSKQYESIKHDSEIQKINEAMTESYSLKII